jgi:hypothetical protein
MWLQQPLRCTLQRSSEYPPLNNYAVVTRSQTRRALEGSDTEIEAQNPLRAWNKCVLFCGSLYTWMGCDRPIYFQKSFADYEGGADKSLAL